MKGVFCNWAMGRRIKKWSTPSVGKMCRCVMWSCYVTWRVREEMFIQLSEQVLEWGSQLSDTKLNIISARREQATDFTYSYGDVFTQLWRRKRCRKTFLALELLTLFSHVVSLPLLVHSLVLLWKHTTLICKEEIITESQNGRGWKGPLWVI